MNYQSVSLKSLADDFHYSQQYLSSLIKKNTGYNLTTLINKIKLSRAVDYLKNTKLTLSEIAEQVGYNSEDYFSKVFKRFYNESPQQYRKKHFM
ncbi:MAG TPA: helix-turn-helix transcriptional regulator [Clostridiaceae bacterium]|nr:helix-turn-helix transcriptional regulator [Clostridiaceae bacterium]